MIAAFARLAAEYPRRWYPWIKVADGTFTAYGYESTYGDPSYRRNLEFDRSRAVLILLVIAISTGLAVGAWITCAVIVSHRLLPLGLTVWLGVPAMFAASLARHLLRTEPLPTEDTLRPAARSRS